jgi:hypothetical protein
MEVAEIVAQFERLKGKFEQEAVDAAISRREEVTPELLRILEEIADPEGARRRAAESDYMAHLYAMYLLAQFRETRAHPLMLKIAHLPGDLLDDILGGFVTEGFGNALASTCGGDISGIQSLIENPAVLEWARGAALGSLATLVAAGVKSRDEIVDYFAELFRGKLTDKNDIVWSDLVVYSTDLCATELLGDIEQAYANDLVDSSVVGLREVNLDFAKGTAWALKRLADDPHRKLIDDTAKEFGWWSCFHPEKKDGARQMHVPSEPFGREWDENRISYKRDTPKIGRNEPCPCGSGKKYKKCCAA